MTFEIISLIFTIQRVRDKVAEMTTTYLFLSICTSVGALCTLMYQLQVVRSIQNNFYICHSVTDSFFFSFYFPLPKLASNFSIAIFQALGIGSMMVLFLFIYCFFGEEVTDRSASIAKVAYLSHWYRYPMQIQKYVKLTILCSNINFCYSGLGIMYCTMVSFNRVRSTTNTFQISLKINSINLNVYKFS